MFILLILVIIESNTFSLISGLSLQSKNTYITTKDFSLICKLQGTVTTSIIIKDPSGGNAGICYPQPTGCGSGAGNTITTNYVEDTVFIDIRRSNINIPLSEGNWSCTNGTTDAIFEVKIFSINKPKVWTESTSPVPGTQVNVEIDCIYPFPDEIRIDYVKESTKAVLKSTTGPTFTNGSASNCYVTDNRAISMKGTFPLSGDKLNGAKVLIAAVVLVNGDVLDIGYSNFTFQSEGCNYSDTELFLGGFSCFLIVLITTIIMLIILACKMLPEKFVDLSTNKKIIKIIIIAVFILVALIIGLALGFGLKECNQRDLGLGLGLGLGFLLAIALVVTLYIYHRQCDSKKGNEDENRESPTEINSKKPEDNPKRVRSTASASHVKMESKVHSEN